METTHSPNLLQTCLDDNSLPSLWFLYKELLPRRTTGDETHNHVFGEVVCFQCKAANRCNAEENKERLRHSTVTTTSRKVEMTQYHLGGKVNQDILSHNKSNIYFVVDRALYPVFI